MPNLEPFEPLILTFHILICLFLIAAILLQAGKGADMGAAFGAGSSQTLFGARGAATLLSKITTVAAVLFLLTSIGLAGIQKNRGIAEEKKSVVTETTEPVVEHKAPSVEPSAAPPTETRENPK